MLVLVLGRLGRLLVDAVPLLLIVSLMRVLLALTLACVWVLLFVVATGLLVMVPVLLLVVREGLPIGLVLLLVLAPMVKMTLTLATLPTLTPLPFATVWRLLSSARRNYRFGAWLG